MNDAISRCELFNRLATIPAPPEANDFKAEVYKAIQSMETVESDWISVEDRLPDEEEEVLVTVYFMGLKQKHPSGWNDHIKPNYYVEIAERIGEDWSSVTDDYKVARDRHVVIAWRPLPAPYKEENGKR